MSFYKNKSQMLESLSKELHDSLRYILVGHSAYFACFHLISHLCYNVLKITKKDLETGCAINNEGIHARMSNMVLIKSQDRNLRNNYTQLKKLRTSADYEDCNFDSEKSRKSIDLMNKIIPELNKIK